MSSNSTRGTILYFSAHYLPNLGGVEFYTRSLSLALAKMGYNVYIVCEEPGGERYEASSPGRGQVHVIRLDRWGWQRVPFLRQNARTRRCLSELFELDWDYVLINMRFYGLCRIGARFARKAGIRAVLIDHVTGYIPLSNALFSAAIKVMDNFLTGWLKRIGIDFYGVSYGVSQWLKTFGITSCGEIPNAIDAEAFVKQSSGRDFRAEHHIAKDTICAAFASRLLKEKGVETVIETARRLKHDERVHFFIAGAGPMEQCAANADGELANLTFLGKLGHPDLSSLLLQSDICCYPTHYSEGMPTCLLEAGASKMALISTQTGGVSEIIPSQDFGIVLEKGDAFCVERAITSLVNNPQRMNNLKENAYAHIVENFTWERCAKRALAACESAQHRQKMNC